MRVGALANGVCRYRCRRFDDLPAQRFPVELVASGVRAGEDVPYTQMSEADCYKDARLLSRRLRTSSCRVAPVALRIEAYTCCYCTAVGTHVRVAYAHGPKAIIS